VAADTKSPSGLQVRYPQVLDENPRDFDSYFLDVLRLSLEKSGKPFELVPVSTPLLVEERSVLNLRDGHYDLHWLNTSAKREKQLIAIRVPLFKGLTGWRLLLIKRESAAAFGEVTGVDDLRRFKTAQGHDWPDQQIFRDNKLPVEASSDWAGLFRMLELGRIDYFPRSVFEIWREQVLFKEMDFLIEEKLVLHYPAAYYFFLGKQHADLAKVIDDGLRKAVNDGSFDALFQQRFGDVIRRARLHERKILPLHNASFKSPADEKLWFKPTSVVTE
jgi:hypothetical protein